MAFISYSFIFGILMRVLIIHYILYMFSSKSKYGCKNINQKLTSNRAVRAFRIAISRCCVATNREGI